MHRTVFLLIAIAAATTSPHLRRRLQPGIPDAIDVTVPCTAGNTTTCGTHGQCRAEACHCDPGWSSPTRLAPCSAQGPSQLKMALLQYFFGWFGLPAFLLGWEALGIATVLCLVLMCGSYCTWLAADHAVTNLQVSKTDAAEHVILQHTKDKYARRQVCAVGVGFCSCCAWFWLWVVVSVFISLSAHCVTKSGAPCKQWRRL